MKTVVFIALFFLGSSACAHAYVDPNTGGYVFQLFFPVIAAITACYVFFKNQVKQFFLKLCLLFRKPDGKS